MKTIRAKFSQDAAGYVTASYTDDCGDRVERVFMAPVTRGYVREYRGGDWKQVCDGLSGMGSTLVTDRDHLLGLIRAEYRRMRRYEKQWSHSWGAS